jgi:dGTPase
VRVVEVLERDGVGLNLTDAVIDGILGHSGRAAEPATLEGRIVRLVDRIAYINHDIDDAVRAGVLAAADLPDEPIAILGDSGSRRIDALVHDLVEESSRAGAITQSAEIGSAMLALRDFMFEHVYLGPEATRESVKIRRAVSTLFDHFCDHAEELPDPVSDAPHWQRVADHIAGMTDRFAVAQFEALTVPTAFNP